ncbi:MAG: hypothetical protein SX243_04325 [Acidobacteriota bacterium]|nr:hypothetical protein [Acidobacteriota bacterium]
MRTLSALTTLLLTSSLLAGCAGESPRFQRLILGGEGGNELVGNWYAPGGSLEMQIRRTDEGSLSADFRMRPGGAALLATWTEGEDLHVRIDGLGGPRTVILRRLQGPDLLPPGSDACLGAHHVWLFRNPHPSWIASERLREHGHQVGRVAEDAFDWLVRAL